MPPSAGFSLPAGASLSDGVGQRQVQQVLGVDEVALDVVGPLARVGEGVEPQLPAERLDADPDLAEGPEDHGHKDDDARQDAALHYFTPLR